MNPKNKKVIVYSTPTCPYCKMAKNFFNENKVEFEEFDVSSNLEKRKEMITKSGQMGVPVIIIEGKLIVGFNKPQVMDLLKIKE